MDTRKILQKEKPLTILLDTPSFDELLYSDTRAESILDYTKNDQVRIIRSDNMNLELL